MFKKETIMKKTSMTPETQVVKVELQHMIANSPLPIKGTTSNASDLLGRGGSDWDDED